MRHVKRYRPVAEPCDGPLIWFDAGKRACPDCGGHTENMAVLECAACGYIVTTGNFHNDAHADTPVMREGYAYG